jgi:hypothetical protein
MWVEEGPYLVDTSLVPRGGARRRKSMEPKALANLNGAVVSSPVKVSRETAQTAPHTPSFNRRDSYAWIRTPPENFECGADENGGASVDWGHCDLTPVPRTPAPEEIQRFAEGIMPGTPTVALNFGQEDELLMKTCPPKNKYSELGKGVLSPEKDSHVMMRLMAARRKSLQFAPKVASPLSRAWS